MIDERNAEIASLRDQLAAVTRERDEADKCLIDSQCVADSRAIVIDNLAAQLDLVTRQLAAAQARAGRLEGVLRAVLRVPANRQDWNYTRKAAEAALAEPADAHEQAPTEAVAGGRDDAD